MSVSDCPSACLVVLSCNKAEIKIQIQTHAETEKERKEGEGIHNGGRHPYYPTLASLILSSLVTAVQDSSELDCSLAVSGWHCLSILIVCINLSLCPNFSTSHLIRHVSLFISLSLLFFCFLFIVFSYFSFFNLLYNIMSFRVFTVLYLEWMDMDMGVGYEVGQG